MPRRLALLVEAQEPGALNLCRAFHQAGHEVVVLNRGPRPAAHDRDVHDLGKASAVVDLYADQPRDERAFYLLNSAGHRLAQAGLGPLAKPALLAAFDARTARPVRAKLEAALREHPVDAVWGFWGQGPLPEFRALQLAKAEPALVHQFQTYALGKARYDAPKPASPVERAVFGTLDGRAHASAEMEAYLDKALRPARGVDQVLPEAWGSWACARRRRARLSEQDGQPHVVHMGVPPVTQGMHDDVGPQLRAIAAQGIAVHAVEAFGTEGGLRTFPRLGLRQLLEGEVAEFMTQFDALVLLYNVPPGLQWFATNMPARFLSAVSAGIPVAVPRGLTVAVERFVERHGNGFAFDAPQDLAAQLRDAEAMAKRRKLAEALAREHRLERFLPQYDEFLGRALDLRGGRWPDKPTPPGPVEA